MKLILDTNAFLWFVRNDSHLSRPARASIEAADSELYLNIASAWELSIKISAGKLSVGKEVGDFLREQLTLNGIELLPIGTSALSVLAVLPYHHRDPFDRLLVAQSLSEAMRIVSSDTALDAYGIRRIW